MGKQGDPLLPRETWRENPVQHVSISTCPELTFRTFCKGTGGRRGVAAEPGGDVCIYGKCPNQFALL